jgi:hypothetical protein
MKRDPIDLLVREWAYRCKKGYPDINNEEDKKVLDMIMKEWALEEQEEQPQEERITVDEIIKLLQKKRKDLSLEFLKKLYTQVNTKGRGYGTAIRGIIKEKALEAVQNPIFQAIHDSLGEQKFLEFYNDTNRHLTLKDLEKGGNIFNIVESKTGLPKDFIQSLYNITHLERGKGVGKAEVLLALLGSEGRSLNVGDVSIEGNTVEVKTDKGRLGKREGNLEKLYNKLQELVPGKPSERDLSIYISELIKNSAPEDTEERKQFLEKVRDILNQEFNSNFTEAVDLTDSSEIQQTLLKWYTDIFLEGDAAYAKFIAIVISEELRMYGRDTFKEAILGQEVKLTNFTKSNKAPQLIGFK